MKRSLVSPDGHLGCGFCVAAERRAKLRAEYRTNAGSRNGQDGKRGTAIVTGGEAATGFG